MATSGDDFKYDGQVTIQLTRHGDEISVWPSNELKGGLAISLMDVEEPRTNVGIATPAEWDAFVAAGDRALGRKPVRDFPPGPLPRARPSTDAEIVAWMADLYREDTPIAEALGRAALAMAREAGSTVPRGAVEAVVDRLARVAAVLESHDSFAQREARQVLWKVLDDMKAMVDTNANPTTKEPGHADD